MRLALLSLLLSVASCAASTRRSPSPPPTTAKDPYFSTTDFYDYWIEQSRERLHVGGTDLWLVTKTSPGEGGALFVTRSDGRVLGAYQFDFGGKGGDVSVVARCVTGDWALLELRAEGLARGWWKDPGTDDCPASKTSETDADTDPCYVPSDTKVTFAEIAVDATHVWLVSAASEDQPERTCYGLPRPK